MRSNTEKILKAFSAAQRIDEPNGKALFSDRQTVFLTTKTRRHEKTKGHIIKLFLVSWWLRGGLKIS